MDNIIFALKILMTLFIYMVIIKIYMSVVAYIGERLGYGKFFIDLWRKIRKK